MENSLKKKQLKEEPHSIVRMNPMEVVLSFHCKKRFVERVLNVPENRSVKYVNMHNQQVYEKMRIMLQESTPLYENYNLRPGDSRIVNIYIYQDILFIFAANYVLLTVWKIKYNHDYKSTVESSRSQILTNKIKINTVKKIQKKLGRKLEQYDFAIETIKSIEIGSTEIESKLKELTKERSTLVVKIAKSTNYMKEIKENNRIIMKEILYNFVD